jgi:hypothetical protein
MQGDAAGSRGADVNDYDSVQKKTMENNQNLILNMILQDKELSGNNGGQLTVRQLNPL